MAHQVGQEAVEQVSVQGNFHPEQL
jgi:hypothetical protein